MSKNGGDNFFPAKAEGLGESMQGRGKCLNWLIAMHKNGALFGNTS